MDNSTYYELYTIYILEKDELDSLRDISYQIMAVYYPNKKLPIVYSISKIHTLTLESDRESTMHIEGESINNKDDTALFVKIKKEALFLNRICHPFINIYKDEKFNE